jgi:sporulation protein YlmC with PRC-barrel domain
MASGSDSGQSVAGEEDPGAALDTTGDRAAGRAEPQFSGARCAAQQTAPPDGLRLMLLEPLPGAAMQTQDMTRDTPSLYATRADGPGPGLMSVDSLMGNDVYNHDGEDLGDVKNMMIDMASGRIAYAVVSFGGFLGMGDKLFAVPWAALTLDTVNKRFTLAVSKDVLKDAPGFDKDHWPTMTDQTWAGGVHKFYGTKHGG